MNKLAQEISVLNHGYVVLEDYMASDLSIINAAKASFAKRQDSLEEGNDKLINFMMRERHGSVFEHSVFRFIVKCPIFVAREWFRHRMSSFNEHSARYSVLQPEFYVPERDQVRTQVGKPGHYTFERVEDDDLAEIVGQKILETQENAYQEYIDMLDQGIAKEIARVVMPVGIYTQFYWTINARSLMNFLSLRNSEHAQFEIREYAKVLEDLFGQVMPITHQTFLENNRVAP